MSNIGVVSNIISTQIRAACRAAIYGSASLLALTPVSLVVTPSMTRAETISGTVPSVPRSVAGQPGNDASGDGNDGGPGQTPADVSVELSSTAVVSVGGVQLTSSGGRGGEGSGASGVDKNGGAGGAGATGSTVTLTLDAGSQVNSSVSTGGITMQSSGGMEASMVIVPTTVPMEHPVRARPAEHSTTRRPRDPR